MIDVPNQHQPKGWHPPADFGPFSHCTVCGAWLDCREFDQVTEHLHGGKDDMIEMYGPPHGGHDGISRRI
jgi:hypothetical protein